MMDTRMEDEEEVDLVLSDVVDGDEDAASKAGGNGSLSPPLSILSGAASSHPSAEFTATAALRRPLAVSGQSGGVLNEHYRVLFTKLENISIKKSYTSFALTSAVKGEGKTVTSINLSYVMSMEFKKRVLLIESDMRAPTFRSYFIWDEGVPGLREIFYGGARAVDAVMKVEGSGLHVIHAGNNLPSREPIDSLKIKELIDGFKAEFDYIIIDALPIIPLADMNILSGLVDGLVLVVMAGSTPRDTLVKAVQSISVDKIVGVVLNGAESPLKKYYRYK